MEEIMEVYNPKDKRRERYKKQKKHDASIAKKCRESAYGFYAYYHWQEDKKISKWETEPLEKPFLKKYYKSAHTDAFHFYKKEANRKVRHNKEVYKHSTYKKLYDYVWKVYD